LKTIKTTPLFNWLLNESKRINFLYGSAGSGKSYQVAIYLLKKFFEEDGITILCTRKTTPALKMTTYKIWLELLDKYFSSYKWEHNKTDMIIRFRNNEAIFKGLDEPSKIRSAEFNYIHMEEATEFSVNDYRELLLRLRKPNNNLGSFNQMILSTNPISIFSWCYQDIYTSPDPSIAKHKSTWKDNPFLDQTYIDELQKLTGNYRKIFLEGEFGMLEGLVFPNFTIYDKVHDTVKDYCYGCDFGYTAPSAFIKVMFLDSGQFIADELIYETGLTNTELIKKVKDIIPENDRDIPIYCDSSEADRIQEFYQADLNPHKSRKDIVAGIDFMIQNFLGCTARSINLNKELRMYSFGKDKMNILLPKPIKSNDHAIDAIRYASYSHQGNMGYSHIADFSFR